MAEYKNIVVLGASFAGHTVVNELVPILPPTHRIILVERNEFFFYPIGVPRAIVVPGWESKVTAPAVQETIFKTGSIHRLVAPNSVVELKKNSVVLEHPFEGSNEIFFDKCVIATGSSQPNPLRPASGSTLEEYKSFLTTMQSEIAAATQILMIGGGAAGIEVAGEIISNHPDKKLIIVHSDDGLLHPSRQPVSTVGKRSYVAPPTTRKLANQLGDQLTALGAELFLSDRVVFPPTSVVKPDEWNGKAGALGGLKKIQLKSGKTVEADYVFVSTGNIPNSTFVQKADPTAVTDGKLVIVDEYFRVLSEKEDSPLQGEYYALGDVATVVGDKSAFTIQHQGPVLAKNIVNDINGKGVQPYVPSRIVGMLITLGTKGGAGSMNLPFLGVCSLPSFMLGMKSGDYMVGKAFYSRFQGSQKVSA